MFAKTQTSTLIPHIYKSVDTLFSTLLKPFWQQLHLQVFLGIGQFMFSDCPPTDTCTLSFILQLVMCMHIFFLYFTYAVQNITATLDRKALHIVNDIKITSTYLQANIYSSYLENFSCTFWTACRVNLWTWEVIKFTPQVLADMCIRTAWICLKCRYTSYTWMSAVYCILPDRSSKVP